MQFQIIISQHINKIKLCTLYFKKYLLITNSNFQSEEVHEKFDWRAQREKEKNTYKWV